MFLDLIDDYMALYDIKKKLKTDIKREEYPMRHNRIRQGHHHKTKSIRQRSGGRK